VSVYFKFINPDRGSSLGLHRSARRSSSDADGPLSSDRAIVLLGRCRLAAERAAMKSSSAKTGPELGRFLELLRRRIDPDVRDLGSYARFPSRVGRRVTQEELAAAIGVTREWYALLECGAARTRASRGLLDRLADALMLTPEERARLFQLALPELWPVPSSNDSIAVLGAFSRLRSLSNRLWAATSVEDVVTNAREEIAGLFGSAVLVHSARRYESGLWEVERAEDTRRSEHYFDVLSDLRTSLRTSASLDDLLLYPRLESAGDVGTPELWPLPLQREVRRVCERHRTAGFTGLYARVRSRSGFVGGFYITHEFGHAYSASDHALLAALADLTSFALS
jgi:transcriptional regulator with XRE-family HTH domain